MKMLKRICAMFLTVVIASSYMFSVPVFAAEDADGNDMKSAFSEWMSHYWDIAIEALLNGETSDAASSNLMLMKSSIRLTNSDSEDVVYLTLMPSYCSIEYTSTGYKVESKFEQLDNLFDSFNIYQNKYNLKDYPEQVDKLVYSLYAGEIGTLGAVKVTGSEKNKDIELYPIKAFYGLDLVGTGKGEYERWFWSFPTTGSVLYCSDKLEPVTKTNNITDVNAAGYDQGIGYDIDHKRIYLYSSEKEEHKLREVSPRPVNRFGVNGLDLAYLIARIETLYRESGIDSLPSGDKHAKKVSNYCSKYGLKDEELLLHYLNVPLYDNGYTDSAAMGSVKDAYLINACSFYYSWSKLSTDSKFENADNHALSLAWCCLYSIHNEYFGDCSNKQLTSSTFEQRFADFGMDLGEISAAITDYMELSKGDSYDSQGYMMAANIIDSFMMRIIGGDSTSPYSQFLNYEGGVTDLDICVTSWFHGASIARLQKYFGKCTGLEESPEKNAAPYLHKGLKKAIEKYRKILSSILAVTTKSASDTITEAADAQYEYNSCELQENYVEYVYPVLYGGADVNEEFVETLVSFYVAYRQPGDDNYSVLLSKVQNDVRAYCSKVGLASNQKEQLKMMNEYCIPNMAELLDNDGVICNYIRKMSTTGEVGAWRKLLIKEHDAAISFAKTVLRPSGVNVYVTDYFEDNTEGSPYNPETTNGLVIDAYLQSAYELYTSKKAVQYYPYKGLDTLELRIEIIDTCQKYNYDYSDDYRVQEVLSDTKAFWDNIYSTANIDTKGLDFRNFLSYGVFTSDYMGDYYAYQVMLNTEIAYSARLLYDTFMISYIETGGIDTTLLSKELEAINITYRLTYHYMFEGITGYLNDATPGKPFANLQKFYTFLVEYGYLSAREYTQDLYDERIPTTLFWTANTNGTVQFSYNYLEGRALSATYIPMNTNLYDPYAILDYADLEWVENFHYKYGFHRKALMIDTNPDAARDYFTTESSGPLRVATLNDLLNCESDIVLYIDENFYNIKSVAEKQQLVYDRLTSVEKEATFFDNLIEGIVGVNETDPVRIFKHAEIDTYSNTIADRNNLSDISYTAKVTNTTPVSDAESEGSTDTIVTEINNPNSRLYDNIILDYPRIKEYLIDAEEYSDMMSYAFVSTIYRDVNTFNSIAMTNAAVTPVLVSSPQAALIYKDDVEAFGSMLNYALLKNLREMCAVGYAMSSDMTSPIYTDIYGNIVTESGLVVVPAACNMTLHNAEGTMYYPICSGYLSTYGKSWSIPADWDLNEDWMSEFFYKNSETGAWDIRNRTIAGVSMDFSRLSYSEKTINKAFKEWYQFDITNSIVIHTNNSLNILHETMRGAPLDCIDFDAENLNLNRTVDKSGLIAAAKLDSIINSLEWDTENSIMSIPSLSFIDNYQYVVVFVFKILLVIVVTALMITVYVDAMKSSISGKTVIKCLGVLLVGVSSVLILPVSYELSYYQSNKALLQDEAEYIMMLNTEKNMAGREIGVYQVTEPEQTTQVLLKLEDYKFDWISELPNVIFSDSIDVLDASYQEFLKSSPLINNEIVQVKNDGTYMDVQDIFDTSVLNFSTETKNLYQKVSVDPVASYYTPYYYFLDALLNNMNNYNSVHNIYAYSTKMMRGGQVKTVNLCSAYFNSPEFQDVYDDLLGLYQIYEVSDDIIYDDVFDNSIIEPAKSSQWYVGTFLKEEEVLKRLDLMTTKAQEFVVDNRDLIGKVTDETFLKCMAMSLAIDYNQLFGIPSADALEIYNLSNADLIRLTVADRDVTLEDSPMSFARFVYNEAGTPGVYASVFLVITTMFVQTMKTVLTIGIFIILLVSVFVLKILLRKQNHSFAGYLLTLAIICGTNVLYALILKVSLFIPTLGIPPTVCIIIQVLIQLGYLFILGMVFMFALRDWRNGGFNYYNAIGGNIKSKAGKLFSRFRSNRHGGNGGVSGFSSDDRPRGVNGWKYFERLDKQQKKREKKAGR